MPPGGGAPTPCAESVEKAGGLSPTNPQVRIRQELFRTEGEVLIRGEMAGGGRPATPEGCCGGGVGEARIGGRDMRNAY